MTKIIIAQRIEALRESKGLLQLELAQLAQIEPSYVSKLEKGQAPNVSAIILARIARSLGTSLDYLVGLTNDPVPSPNPDTLSAVEQAARDPLLRRILDAWPHLSPALKQSAVDLLEHAAEHANPHK